MTDKSVRWIGPCGVTDNVEKSHKLVSIQIQKRAYTYSKKSSFIISCKYIMCNQLFDVYIYIYICYQIEIRDENRVVWNKPVTLVFNPFPHRANI